MSTCTELWTSLFNIQRYNAASGFSFAFCPQKGSQSIP